MKLKYYHNLDGLRAIAAFGVLIAHCLKVDELPGQRWLYPLVQQGNSGVSLFFVLSGFVITRILLSSTDSPRYFINFYGRRTLRIFPLYYLALCCYLFLPWLLNWVDHLPRFSEAWYHFAYLQNFARTFEWKFSGPGHYWSLAVEEHFYLIWPAIVYLLRGNRSWKLIVASIALIMLATGLRWIMFRQGLEINVFTFTRMDQLSLGCILAICERNGWFDQLPGRETTFFAIILIGLISVAGCSQLSPLSMNVFKHLAYGTMFFGLLGYVICASSDNCFNRLLNSRVFQFLGKISYGLYVWHVLIFHVFLHHVASINPIIDFILISIATIGISTASWVFFEKRILKLKRMFEN